MSDILIKGMEMPKGCVDCPLNFDATCNLIPFGRPDETNGSKRRADCPLIPVPDHGRLGDLDELYRKLYQEECIMDKQYIDYLGLVVEAPTIIPADCKEERTVKWREWNTFVPASQADKEDGE